jgi:hypothetical protein
MQTSDVEQPHRSQPAVEADVTPGMARISMYITRR